MRARAVTAAAAAFEDHAIARVEPKIRFALDVDAPSVQLDERDAKRLARCAALQAVRRNDSSLEHARERDTVGENPVFAQQSVTAAMRAGAAGAAPQRLANDLDRVFG